MNSHPRPQIRTLAFTLIELLTVIAIIAILMGLLFPAIAIVKEQARKAQAKADVTQIVSAVKAYYTEYGKYPPTSTTASNNEDIILGESTGATDTNEKLFNTLRSINAAPNTDYALNPRRINFFDGKSVSDNDHPKGGFADNGGTGVQGAFYDPWGRQYGVVIDSNYNEVVNVSKVYKDFTTGTDGDKGARVGVAAFSTGKDNIAGDKNFPGQFKDSKGKPSDDIISWQ